MENNDPCGIEEAQAELGRLSEWIASPDSPRPNAPGLALIMAGAVTQNPALAGSKDALAMMIGSAYYLGYYDGTHK